MSDRDYKRMEFETTVKAVGNTGMVTLPRALVGKRVRITVEVIDD